MYKRQVRCDAVRRSAVRATRCGAAHRQQRTRDLGAAAAHGGCLDKGATGTCAGAAMRGVVAPRTCGMEAVSAQETRRARRGACPGATHGARSGNESNSRSACRRKRRLGPTTPTRWCGGGALSVVSVWAAERKAVAAPRSGRGANVPCGTAPAAQPPKPTKKTKAQIEAEKAVAEAAAATERNGMCGVGPLACTDMDLTRRVAATDFR